MPRKFHLDLPPIGCCTEKLRAQRNLHADSIARRAFTACAFHIPFFSIEEHVPNPKETPDEPGDQAGETGWIGAIERGKFVGEPLGPPKFLSAVREPQTTLIFCKTIPF